MDVRAGGSRRSNSHSYSEAQRGEEAFQDHPVSWKAAGPALAPDPNALLISPLIFQSSVGSQPDGMDLGADHLGSSPTLIPGKFQNASSLWYKMKMTVVPNSSG